MKHVPPPAGEPIGAFDNLAMAVSPAWHQAIIRLANASERVAERMGWVVEVDPDRDPTSEYVANVRLLVDQLLEFLDGLDADPDLEPTLGFMNGPPEMDECEVPEDAEPSLGSFDRMMDQEKAWRTVDRNPDVYGWSSNPDNELDDCDYEDSDPGEESDPGPGDYDGLMEQVGTQDWQHGSQG